MIPLKYTSIKVKIYIINIAIDFKNHPYFAEKPAIFTEK